MSKHYLGRTGRFLLAASTISGITFLSALAADANTPAAGTTIENQATAEFTDEATGGASSIVSDTVKVTVAEVAGITGSNNGVIGDVYRTKVVNFKFKITNAGNDPTKFFIPGTVSKAIYESTINGAGQAIPTAKIGTLSLVAYKADGQATTQEIAIATSGANVNTIPTNGASTGDILALVNSTNTAIAGNGGSIKSGGYVVIRVPVEIPYDAKTGTDNVEITLGNTATTPGDNQAYVAGGANPGNNDLYTVDNTGTDNGDAATTAPANGEKETSIVQTASVVDPGTVMISGTVYDDRNNSGSGGGTIFTTGEFGTNGVFGTGTVKVKAVLINTDTGAIIDSQVVADGAGTNPKGFYEFTAPAITNVKVILVKETDTGTTTPALPDTWVKTAEISRTFRTDLAAIPSQDFGIRQKGKLILLKRITKVAGNATTTDDTTDNFNGAGANKDIGTNWPSGFIKGAVDAGQVKPGDKIEYTIYFLNNQGADVTKARICDQIKGVQTYDTGSMKLGVWDGTTTPLNNPATRTDVSTDTDKANTFASGATVIDCNLNSTANSNTATAPGVLVDIADATNKIRSAKPTAATGTAVTYPAGSYGYFRFTTTVDGTTPGSASGGSGGGGVPDVT